MADLMPEDWKPWIIGLTELPSARAAKRDASFFPPVPEIEVARWEDRHELRIPVEARSFLLQSDGLEAARGEWWPVLPLRSWEDLRDDCGCALPWLRFGETSSHRYLISLGHSPSIYRSDLFGSEPEFHSATLGKYLEKLFRDGE